MRLLGIFLKLLFALLNLITTTVVTVEMLDGECQGKEFDYSVGNSTTYNMESRIPYSKSA